MTKRRVVESFLDLDASNRAGRLIQHIVSPSEMADLKCLLVESDFKTAVGSSQPNFSRRTAPGKAPVAGFHVEDSFFEQSEALRMQFDWRVAAVSREKTESPMELTSVADLYRCLSSTADQLFGQEVVLSFLDRLRSWAREKLSLNHASSPQVRVYTKGCWRVLAPDDVRASWHYLFSLTRSGAGSTNRIRVLADSPVKRTRWLGVGLNRVATVRLGFNQLLVHETKWSYGVEENPESPPSPFEGAVFLDGYLW